jgi:uncharacterized protein YecE (DUF72 family)
VLYLRFHGRGEQLCRYNYSREELSGWVARLQPQLSGRALYAFFNNDYEARATRLYLASCCCNAKAEFAWTALSLR